MDNREILQSLEMIENKLFDKLCIDELAKNLFISKFHYQRMFHTIVGDSVMDYVKKRRLSLAGRELAESDTTVIDIALKFGYSTHESFTRAFKAYMGVTPTEYRKYKLLAISQKQLAKEEKIMKSNYSKNTDEIIRGLNELIASAHSIAELVVKNPIPHYKGLWEAFAKQTDYFADKLQNSLGEISSAAGNPDEITKSSGIMEIIDQAAFNTNILAFNANLLVARGKLEDREKQKPICEKYMELAQNASGKTQQIATLFGELAKMIFEDMREATLSKRDEVLKLGKEAVKSIVGYDYIRDEVEEIVREISSLEYPDLTTSLFENLAFRMNIISFTAGIDALRGLDAKGMVESIEAFSEGILDMREFLNGIVGYDKSTECESDLSVDMQNIILRGNILLFYTKGEISYEKLGHLLSEEQKAEFDVIIKKITSFFEIAFAIKTKSKATTPIDNLADVLDEIVSLMKEQKEKLGELGGAIEVLTGEFSNLSVTVKSLIK